MLSFATPHVTVLRRIGFALAGEKGLELGRTGLEKDAMSPGRQALCDSAMPDWNRVATLEQMQHERTGTNANHNVVKRLKQYTETHKNKTRKHEPIHNAQSCFQTFRLALNRTVIDRKLETSFSKLP